MKDKLMLIETDLFIWFLWQVILKQNFWFQLSKVRDGIQKKNPLWLDTFLFLPKLWI